MSSALEAYQGLPGSHWGWPEKLGQALLLDVAFLYCGVLEVGVGSPSFPSSRILECCFPTAKQLHPRLASIVPSGPHGQVSPPDLSSAELSKASQVELSLCSQLHRHVPVPCLARPHSYLVPHLFPPPGRGFLKGRNSNALLISVYSGPHPGPDVE